MNTSKVANTRLSLQESVINNGFCVGCGACAAVDPSLRMTMNPFGQYVAEPRNYGTQSTADAAAVCPFADGNPNEDQLSRECFGTDVVLNQHVGHQLQCFAGWALERDCRASGSSGGLASWLLGELLRKGLVTHVVHVGATEDTESTGALFRYRISTTPLEVSQNSKSRYYPIEMSEMLKAIREVPGRYVVVGVPCYIKAVRLACRRSSVFRDRVAFTVAIVCGHLKSTAFADLLAWQCGIPPGNVTRIDFRTKLCDRAANQYGTSVEGRCGDRAVQSVRPMADLFGGNWGHGFFRYRACDFCDDVVGETADISFGDAWLPEYVTNPDGTNVVVVRNAQLLDILRSAVAAGRIHLEEISPGRVAESQAGGFRHRRDGLAYRLLQLDRRKAWRPKKRVAAEQNHLTRDQQRLYSLRSLIADTSHEAFREATAVGQLEIFVNRMKPLIRKYDRVLYRTYMPLPKRLYYGTRSVLGYCRRKLVRAIRGFCG